MASDQSDDRSAAEQLSPKTLTDRFNSVSPGDRLVVNNHEQAYEVVDTETYAVIAEDSDGHRVTFSQNLQSGGWTLNEEIFHVDIESK
jgi:hypothetical protein